MNAPIDGSDDNNAESLSEAEQHREEPSLGERAARSVGWAMVQAWGSRVVSMTVVVLLGRLLEPKHFGLVALGSVFVEFGYWLADGGFGKAIVSRREVDDELLDTGFWTAVIISLSLIIVLVVTAPLLAAAMDEPRLTTVIRLLSLNYVFIALGAVPIALLQRALNFRSLALRQMLSTVTGAVAGCALALGGAGVYALIAQTLGSAACSLVVLWRATTWRPRLRFRRDYFREMFTFGSKVIGSEVLTFAGRRGDDFLIGALLGPTQLGYYVIAFRILTILTELLTGTFGAVAYPLFSRLAGDRRRSSAAYLAVVRYSAVVAFPAFLGLCLLAPEIIATVFGPQWLPSTASMRVLALMGCLSAITYFFPDFLIANGRPGWVFRYLMVSVPVLLAAFAIGSVWGIVGVATARIIAHALLFPIDLSMVRRVAGFRLDDYFSQYVRPLMCASVMVAVVAALRGAFEHRLDSALATITLVSVGALTYLAALTTIARPLARELVGRAADIAPLGKIIVRLRVIERLGLGTRA